MARTNPKARRQTGGNNYGLIVVNQPNQPNQPNQQHTADEVKALLRGTRITIDDDFINVMGADEAYVQIERVLDMFADSGVDPDEYISGFGFERYAKDYSVLGWTYTFGDAKVYLNSDRFNDIERVSRAYESSVLRGYHPKGTTYQDVITHEAGHRIGTAINEKFNSTRIDVDGKQYSGMDAFSMYVKSKPQDHLVDLAIKNVKNTEYGKGKSATQLRGSISQYALKNKRETIAEAYADYWANKGNANPLSIEIVKQARKYLGE